MVPPESLPRRREERVQPRPGCRLVLVHRRASAGIHGRRRPRQQLQTRRRSGRHCSCGVLQHGRQVLGAHGQQLLHADGLSRRDAGAEVAGGDEDVGDVEARHGELVGRHLRKRRVAITTAAATCIAAVAVVAGVVAGKRAATPYAVAVSTVGGHAGAALAGLAVVYATGSSWWASVDAMPPAALGPHLSQVRRVDDSRQRGSWHGVLDAVAPRLRRSRCAAAVVSGGHGVDARGGRGTYGGFVPAGEGHGAVDGEDRGVPWEASTVEEEPSQRLQGLEQHRRAPGEHPHHQRRQRSPRQRGHGAPAGVVA